MDNTCYLLYSYSNYNLNNILYNINFKRNYPLKNRSSINPPIRPFERTWNLTPHKQSYQRLATHLATPVPVHGGVKDGARRQHIGRIEVLARLEDA